MSVVQKKLWAAQKNFFRELQQHAGTKTKPYNLIPPFAAACCLASTRHKHLTSFGVSWSRFYRQNSA